MSGTSNQSIDRLARVIAKAIRQLRFGSLEVVVHDYDRAGGGKTVAEGLDRNIGKPGSLDKTK
jgi:hypothetical protein